MNNGIEGIPGSGKSYEAVVYHVLPMLAQGRKVITNLPLVLEAFSTLSPEYLPLIELRVRVQPVRGTWDAERVDEHGNGSAFELFADGHVEKPEGKVSIFGHVWDYWTEWKHPKTGQGPLFIIDECHVGMPKLGTDPQVIEWYKLHRHFNVDLLLMTQNFRDICPPIAGLLAMLIKTRKADILGKPKSYIRKVHAGYRGAVISTEEREYKPQYFVLYKSHTQGNSVAESLANDVAPLSVKLRRFTRIFWVITFFACLYAAWKWSGRADNIKKASSSSSSQLVVTGPAVKAPAAPASAPAAGIQGAQVLGPDEVPEPYASKEIHLTGRMRMHGKEVYTFAITSSNIRFGQVTSDELAQAGYKWQPLFDCAGTLRWKTTARAITCDAPQSPEGSRADPVVIAVNGSGDVVARSDGPRSSVINSTPILPPPATASVLSK